MERLIDALTDESLRVKRSAVSANRSRLIAAADRVARCIDAGGKLILFGNGGSAADAQHIAAELVNRFRIERPPLAALALTTDTSIITSIGNDYHFDEIFSKQVRALGREGDVAIGITTSGRSPNVLQAVAAARELGIYTVGFTGRGGPLAAEVHLALTVPSSVTARIQETHGFYGHLLCEMIDRIRYPEAFGGP